MLIHPQFNPVALQLGPVAIHWYGLAYLLAFVLFNFLAKYRVKKSFFASRGWVPEDVDDILFYGVIGVILGGRLGYVLFYKPDYYLSHPLEIFAVWQGGMSFHGGLLGVILAMFFFAFRRQRSFWDVADVVAPCVPIGLACGRLANFINGELWGRMADASLPWAMIFPQSGTQDPRHPSQLYQMGLEGLTLFVLLWWYARRERPMGAVAGAFMTGYGVFRFIAEYFRQPDAFLGFLSMGLSMGQWLCVPMILSGIAIWIWAYKTNPTTHKNV